MASLDIQRESVLKWIKMEHGFQFDKLNAAYGDQLAAPRDFIATTEMPSLWFRSVLFREHRKAESLARANHQLLKVLAAAGAVLVYDQCLSGESREAAFSATYHELSAYYQSLDDSDLPLRPWLYEREFKYIFGPDPHERYQTAASLTLRAIGEYQEVTERLQLPLPGIASGPITEWMSPY